MVNILLAIVEHVFEKKTDFQETFYFEKLLQPVAEIAA